MLRRVIMVNIFTLIFFLILLNIGVYAHSNVLEIENSECIPEDYVDDYDIGDGINERWYELVECETNNNTYYSIHIPETVTDIKYYIYDKDDLELWSGNIPGGNNEFINMLGSNNLDGLIQGIQEWNDIYFYDNSGYISKKKIVNFIEGTETDHDISIYCNNDTENISYLGSTIQVETSKINSSIINADEYTHIHYRKWEITIYINVIMARLSEQKSYTVENCKNQIKRTMAHELGHVLGLCDVDELENSNNSNWHHEEILMGYAQNGYLLSRQRNITYKDLAGVAITRGFHTDSDHQWLNMGLQHDGTYKFVCSICNGVMFDAQYYNYLFNEYGSCGGNHTLSSNNMMAVGCKGNKDYIKCKYCRYVAPVEDMVVQNSTCQSVDTTTHIITNSVNGLNYTIYEPHTFTYSIYSSTQHKNTCHCGYEAYERHSITEADYTNGDNIAICIQCKRIVNLNDGMFPVLPTSITKYSINGSFILPNGVVVLVEEDIQSYINNTLIFYEEENLPQIE